MAIDEIVGDSIDRAVNIEMRFRAGLPRGVTYPLYEAARKKQKTPLTWLAAKLLKDKVTAGKKLWWFTASGVVPWEKWVKADRGTWLPVLDLT